jgi:hypothetical protein
MWLGVNAYLERNGRMKDTIKKGYFSGFITIHPKPYNLGGIDAYPMGSVVFLEPYKIDAIVPVRGLLSEGEPNLFALCLTSGTIYAITVFEFTKYFADADGDISEFLVK